MVHLVLDNTLVENTNPSFFSNEALIHSLKLKLPKLENHGFNLLTQLPENMVAINHGFLGLVSDCYSNHRKLEIAPHDIWYLVMTQIAAAIKKNVEACRPLFTKEADSVTITVVTDDVTTISLESVIEQLKNLVPVDINLFVPEFSTLTQSSRMACYAAICDGLQVYYNYMTMMCGIPEIRLTGTLEDWQLMQTNFGKISKLFNSVNLVDFSQYLSRVEVLVGNMIQSSFIKPDVDFWYNIFSRKNVGSGAEFVISGWITEFFFEKCKVAKLENFASTISIVPYTNAETKRRFLGVNGAIMQKRTEDGFVHCDYGQLIFEVVPGLVEPKGYYRY